MNQAEYDARLVKAGMRISRVSPLVGCTLLAFLVVVFLTRVMLHLFVGVVIAAQVGMSLWFGILFAGLSVQTLGRLWWWGWRQSCFIERLERYADQVETADAPSKKEA